MHRITLNWVGGAHTFSMDIAALRAVQTSSEAGPGEVCTRLSAGTWRVDDVLGVLRHGLISGGMDRGHAARLVTDMAEAHGLRTLAPTAFLVLTAGLTGESDDPVGEHQGATPPPENGVSAHSMPPGQPEDSAPET